LDYQEYEEALKKEMQSNKDFFKGQQDEARELGEDGKPLSLNA
jgi:hypothetical protein